MSGEIELFSEEELKKEIIRVMKTLYLRGMITALGGNVSARLPGKNECWITPSQVFKGALKEDDLVKMDLEGNVVEGVYKPTMSWRWHIGIYKIRPDVNAVIHAHSPWTLGLISAGKEIKTTITDEAVLVLRKIEKIPFKMPGTEELAEAIIEAAGKGVKAIILENHGVIGLGSNVLDAESVVELMESLAIIEFVCYALGKEPPEIPPEHIELAKKLYRL